jgi:AraC-like DNA-binding protein
LQIFETYFRNRSKTRRAIQFHHYIDLESDSLRWLFITFKEVTQRVGYSERHLRNLFEQQMQMGLTLWEYRNNYQFHRAISLMRDSTRRLTDVAEMSGFNSQSVFTRFIKRMAYQTPRELSQPIREGCYQASERPH